MVVMPPTAEPTATATRIAVPTNSAATERTSVGDMPTSGAAVRGTVSLLPRRGDPPDPWARSARVGQAVEDAVDDRAGVPGGAPVVVEELPGVEIHAVAAGPRPPRPRPPGCSAVVG